MAHLLLDTCRTLLLRTWKRKTDHGCSRSVAQILEVTKLWKYWWWVSFDWALMFLNPLALNFALPSATQWKCFPGAQRYWILDKIIGVHKHILVRHESSMRIINLATTISWNSLFQCAWSSLARCRLVLRPTSTNSLHRFQHALSGRSRRRLPSYYIQKIEKYWNVTNKNALSKSWHTNPNALFGTLRQRNGVYGESVFVGQQRAAKRE